MDSFQPTYGFDTGYNQNFGVNPQLQTEFNTVTQTLQGMSLPELIEEAEMESKDILFLKSTSPPTVHSTPAPPHSLIVPPPLIPADIEVLRKSIYSTLDAYTQSQQNHSTAALKLPLHSYHDEYMAKLSTAYQQDLDLERYRQEHAPPNPTLQMSKTIHQPEQAQIVDVPNDYRCSSCHAIMNKVFRLKETNFSFCESCKDEILNTYDRRTFMPISSEQFSEDTVLSQKIECL